MRADWRWQLGWSAAGADARAGTELGGPPCLHVSLTREEPAARCSQVGPGQSHRVVGWAVAENCACAALTLLTSVVVAPIVPSGARRGDFRLWSGQATA